jgi:hypothetical protein
MADDWCYAECGISHDECEYDRCPVEAEWMDLDFLKEKGGDMNDRQTAWLCGMTIGAIFGVLMMLARGGWVSLVLLGYGLVLVAYLYDLSRPQPPPQ